MTTPAPPAPPDPTDFAALPLRRRATWVVLLGSLAALGAFTVDLYLPAFPVLQRELGASPAAVQLTLTGTMVGVALGQLVVGPLSDALGRRRPLLAGLALHLAASLLVHLAPTVGVLAGLRVLQGVGTASASVIALAVVRDRFRGRGAARLVARLMLVVGVSPVLAPSVGSALLPAVGWRGLFLVLAALSGLLALAVALVLPETHPVALRRRAGVRAAAGAYGALLRDPAVVGLVLVAGLVTSALFAYVAGSSFTLQQQFGLSAGQFGLVFAGGGLALVAGTQANGSLVHRVSSVALLRTALCAGVLAATALAVVAATGALGLPGFLACLAAVMACLGLAMPNSAVLALERHGRTAGTAAALLGACQFGIASVVAPLTSQLGLAPATAMGVVMAAALALALVVLTALVAPALRRPVPQRAAAAAPVVTPEPPEPAPRPQAPRGHHRPHPGPAVRPGRRRGARGAGSRRVG